MSYEAGFIERTFQPHSHMQDQHLIVCYIAGVKMQWVRCDTIIVVGVAHNQTFISK